MMFSSHVPQRLLLLANSRRRMTHLCTQRGSGTGNSTAFPKNKKKTQERRVYKSTADLSPPEEKTPQWAKALESIIKSERQALESIMKFERQSLESTMKSERQALDSKMLGLAALMVSLAAVGFTATSQLIGRQNAIMSRLVDKMP
eukprot:CCRYP_009562-RA/>CCRYP_009562-RA protein AED:0.90 eAED:1.00 QI:0/-1/0/1/-1/1/1/0/145